MTNTKLIAQLAAILFAGYNSRVPLQTITKVNEVVKMSVDTAKLILKEIDGA